MKAKEIVQQHLRAVEAGGWDTAMRIFHPQEQPCEQPRLRGNPAQLLFLQNPITPNDFTQHR